MKWIEKIVKMKIMLIYPTSSISMDAQPLVGNYLFFRAKFPPTALGYLASFLENAGHTVKIVDCQAEEYGAEDVRREIKNFNPDTVGITASTQLIYEAIKIAKITKENNPNCLTVIGGPHVTYLPTETLEECQSIDVVVRGEGERTFLELLETKREKWGEVKGITFRSNGKIINNEDRAFIENLDEIPFPAYHLLPMEKYKIYGHVVKEWINGQPFGGVLTSRGCPYECAFCSSKTLGKKWRTRSPENIIEEIKILKDKYGRREIEFLDDSFTVSEERTLDICKLIKEEGLDISWYCSTRVDRFTKKIAHAIHGSGCHSVFFGLESGVQENLDFLNKGFKLEQSKKAVKLAKKEKINAIAFFIIGLPQDNRKKIIETIKFARKLNPKFAIFHQLTPMPGTKVFKMAEENNLFLTKDWSKYITMSDPVIKIPNIANEELVQLLKKANFGFYIKPSYFSIVIREMINTKSLQIIKDHLKVLT